MGTRDSITDSDLWWLLATGREIAENGIPYTNPWSIYSDQGIVVQQWLAAFVLYQVYAHAGAVGLQLLVLTQAIVLVGVLFALCRAASDGRIAPDSALLVILLVSPALSTYWSTRPHLWSMLAYALQLLVFETYRRTGRKQVLAFAPLITLAHVNLHASMALLDPVIALAYLLPSAHQAKGFFARSIPRGARRANRLALWEKRKWILLAAAVMCAALFANPYGWRGAAYTLLSYGAADYRDYINEMGTVDLWTDYGADCIACGLVFMFLLGRKARANTPLSYLVLPVGLFMISLLHVRNVWLFPLFALPWMAYSMGTFSISRYLPRAITGKVAGSVAAVACAVALLVTSADKFAPWQLEDDVSDGKSTPIAATNYLEQNGYANMRVMATFDAGGWFEWRSQKVDIDARPELWSPGITGFSENLYTKYVDRDRDKTGYSTYLADHYFDFVFATDGSAALNTIQNSGEWEQVVDGNGYTLWKRTGL